MPLVSSFAAHAQVNLHKPSVEPSSVPNFMLPKASDFTPQSPLQDGMIAQEEVAPNAHFDVGLAPMRSRNIHSVKIENELVPTRNPGVAFVIEFPR
jgi:hypothetical protein